MASSLLDQVKRPPQSAETFIAVAEGTSTIAPTSQAPRSRHSADEDSRKHDVPRYTFNLRLNDYELGLLRSLAAEQRESMQKIVKNGLIPYLESLRTKVG